ncbi:MAG: hypothetical protein COW11_04940 [Candidatus Omnitrophica bacterium CG12_big_fil_rev_8_21_14_0_65_43_15]|uniref:Rubrerythrin diiron-binding domain-containing protein n=1 Tax=Candidatus Taenaricola geysiri TaxID=1974752 RepID=A0A2J0LH00_9BACT|nr:MAG: hypothetical protein AUJ89_01100 [Candidatus Omnitrophica bacterium CG1_02_43_210]PIR66074.1 MAG: hypothetical protein COU52_00810 [Candidatus Omnitrophica bacterium CG10_big_fil_rev_8_21_14_0_10_43_8]PIV12395.1 MAG: hypothetical protein COS48_00990 [Candidatus Omnitrophica bacterium CG03_land_8_20_14_0_80_43_22]PIW66134.1 MAG: hypothetical protein COW11_04940 [Candidatus Omnitrophica bacterium CG12_big_fil_rev_8_21_14_0_65_43_15]PIW80533.1 MAG: hypothetical protein COZ98_01880 [Candida
MPKFFNAVEVIDMGIKKEEKRRDFYGYAAEKFQEKDMKELFTKLRDWEKAHIEKFTEIKNGIDETKVTEYYQGEFDAYIKAATDDMLYQQISPEWFAKNVKEPLAAINYGMSFEKDAILFFSELIGYVISQSKDKLQQLINEEKKHLVYLAELKKKYQ